MLRGSQFEQEACLIALNSVQYQDLCIGKNRLRMARGRCHRSLRIKHFNQECFGPNQTNAPSTKMAEEPRKFLLVSAENFSTQNGPTP